MTRDQLIARLLFIVSLSALALSLLAMAAAGAQTWELLCDAGTALVLMLVVLIWTYRDRRTP